MNPYASVVVAVELMLLSTVLGLGSETIISGGNDTSPTSGSIYWGRVEYGYLPRGAFRAGYEFENYNLYVGVASLLGGYVVGKVGERRDGVGGLYAYVGHMGKQYQVTPDIVLVAPVDSVEWVLKRTGEPIPRGAISVGRDPSSGEVYHIGRSAREQHLIPGKIIHSVLYTVLHTEIGHRVYEVLVDKSKA